MVDLGGVDAVFHDAVHGQALLRSRLRRIARIDRERRMNAVQ